MSGPTQRPASTTDARKRAAEVSALTPSARACMAAVDEFFPGSNLVAIAENEVARVAAAGAAVRADLATLRDGLAAAIAYAERHDGRVPVGMLRALLGGEGR